VRGALAWLLLVALLAHGTGLANGFVYDDHRFIVENGALQSAGVGRLVLDPGAQTADSDRDVYRPLRALGHAFDARTWGLRPFGFHLHSLVVHLLNVCLGHALLRRLLPAPSQAPALLGATVLATHPLGVEVVGWASSRGDLYAVCFAMLALLAVLRTDAARPGAGARRLAWLCLAAALAALATMGKESAAWLPIAGFLAWRWLGRIGGAGVTALAAGVGAALVLRQAALAGLPLSQTAPHGGSALAQVAWAFYGTGRTLAAIAWPAGLSVEYPQTRWMTLGPAVWIAWPTCLGVAALATVLIARRRGRRTAAFLLAWVLLAWFPSSSLLVTLRSLVNDRGSYPCLLAAGALPGLLLAGRSPRAAWGASVAVALLLVPLGVQRTAVFHDDASLWRDALRHDPSSVRAHLGLAAAADDPEARQREFQAALDVAPPGSRMRGIAGARLGDFLLRGSGDLAAALPVLRESLELQRQHRDRGLPGPDEAATAGSLAECLLQLGQAEESDRVMQEALREQPGQIMLHVKRTALLLFRAERDQDDAARAAARAALEEGLARDPEHPLLRALQQRLGESPQPR